MSKIMNPKQWSQMSDAEKDSSLRRQREEQREKKYGKTKEDVVKGVKQDAEKYGLHVTVD